ncbi:HET domain-containing protein [Ophiostoma piceae UAMH 11346]|uniref:HET domain-containing protein n=1 Tax=Ophiostoma piceae (strain UAMH 11346) TaxID=1262450 RepID=S3CD79_OPHP1|nr:HET domain-containing protein [Ophiostoma piceae UAMH 11346]
MRLLNVESMKLKTFTKNVPLYAILSHTWDADQEVTFQMMQGSDLGYQQLSGWAKIQDCCKQARSEGWKYVWVDTCCIDKTNSAELSEAINSMFRWYKEAGTCYAYLSDISGTFCFQSSRWFTRGWTLQELIAPRFVFFFDQDWTPIGSRDSLLAEISLSTGIRVDYLKGHDYFRKAPVSEIFYWASQRQTERIEDEAYSLLGLFGIHMPLIYGEREMAFRRLQMAIIQERNDETIFAWLFGEIQDSGYALDSHCKRGSGE